MLRKRTAWIRPWGQLWWLGFERKWTKDGTNAERYLKQECDVKGTTGKALWNNISFTVLCSSVSAVHIVGGIMRSWVLCSRCEQRSQCVLQQRFLLLKEKEPQLVQTVWCGEVMFTASYSSYTITSYQDWTHCWLELSRFVSERTLTEHCSRWSSTEHVCVSSVYKNLGFVLKLFLVKSSDQNSSLSPILCCECESSVLVRIELKSLVDVAMTLCLCGNSVLLFSVL